MRELLKRIEAVEARLLPHGMVLLPWEEVDGRAVTIYEDTRYAQGDDESQSAFFARAQTAIGRTPLLWASPVDVAL